MVILKSLVEISNEKPDKIKILRIKNRLRAGTNDILMNVMFNSRIVS